MRTVQLQSFCQPFLDRVIDLKGIRDGVVLAKDLSVVLRTVNLLFNPFINNYKSLCCNQIRPLIENRVLRTFHNYLKVHDVFEAYVENFIVHYRATNPDDKDIEDQWMRAKVAVGKLYIYNSVRKYEEEIHNESKETVRAFLDLFAKKMSSENIKIHDFTRNTNHFLSLILDPVMIRLSFYHYTGEKCISLYRKFFSKKGCSSFVRKEDLARSIMEVPLSLEDLHRCFIFHSSRLWKNMVFWMDAVDTYDSDETKDAFHILKAFYLEIKEDSSSVDPDVFLKEYRNKKVELKEAISFLSRVNIHDTKEMEKLLLMMNVVHEATIGMINSYRYYKALERVLEDFIARMKKGLSGIDALQKEYEGALQECERSKTIVQDLQKRLLHSQERTCCHESKEPSLEKSNASFLLGKIEKEQFHLAALQKKTKVLQSELQKGRAIKRELIPGDRNRHFRNTYYLSYNDCISALSSLNKQKECVNITNGFINRKQMEFIFIIKAIISQRKGGKRSTNKKSFRLQQRSFSPPSPLLVDEDDAGEYLCMPKSLEIFIGQVKNKNRSLEDILSDIDPKGGRGEKKKTGKGTLKGVGSVKGSRGKKKRKRKKAAGKKKRELLLDKTHQQKVVETKMEVETRQLSKSEKDVDRARRVLMVLNTKWIKNGMPSDNHLALYQLIRTFSFMIQAYEGVLSKEIPVDERYDYVQLILRRGTEGLEDLYRYLLPREKYCTLHSGGYSHHLLRWHSVCNSELKRSFSNKAPLLFNRGFSLVRFPYEMQFLSQKSWCSFPLPRMVKTLLQLLQSPKEVGPEQFSSICSNLFTTFVGFLEEVMLSDEMSNVQGVENSLPFSFKNTHHLSLGNIPSFLKSITSLKKQVSGLPLCKLKQAYHSGEVLLRSMNRVQTTTTAQEFVLSSLESLYHYQQLLENCGQCLLLLRTNTLSYNHNLAHLAEELGVSGNHLSSFHNLTQKLRYVCDYSRYSEENLSSIIVDKLDVLYLYPGLLDGFKVINWDAFGWGDSNFLKIHSRPLRSSRQFLS